MKLCKTCFPIVSEAIDRVSKVKSTMTLDHEDCQNCGISNNAMNFANMERLRATDDETIDEFINKQLEKSKQIYLDWDSQW